MRELTRDQAEARKEKAVRFLENVLHDPDRADAIREESLEDYAERRRIKIVGNPRRPRKRSLDIVDRRPLGGGTMPPSKQDLQERIRELEEECDELHDENEQLREDLDAISDIASGEEEDEDDEGNGRESEEK